jgi:hypothetical protein
MKFRKADRYAQPGESVHFNVRFGSLHHKVIGAFPAYPQKADMDRRVRQAV